ncbi:hypothetical protein [Streptomyces sp. NPDC001985]|uniref:hypothetical protein n=1 Tax=Streptomyces sp. NPDC001985 TaxID=3154406 RepID=UPI003318F5F9
MSISTRYRLGRDDEPERRTSGSTGPERETPGPWYIALHAEIEISGVRYSHCTPISAGTWEIADDVQREAFRGLARSQLASHLATVLPIVVTEEPTP